MSEQELRDRLHASVDSIEAPADLASRAERGWRRRRRNTVVGASLGVLAVLGGVVVALPRSTPDPVTAAPPTVAEEGCVELPAPPGARPAASTSGWAYTGPDSMAKAVIGLALPDLQAKRAARAFPLLASRTVAETAPATWVYALALQQPSGWHVRIGAAEQRGGTLLPIDDVLLPLPQSGVVSAFVTLDGGLFAGPAGGALVALGSSDTQRIDYTGCRNGRTFVTGASGSALVLTTGPVEEAGKLTVQAAGRTVTGRPQDVSHLPLAAPGSTDVSGYGDKLADQELGLVASDRTRTVRFEAADPKLLLAEAVVLGVCSGRGSVRFEDTALPCDGRTHQVWAGPLEFRRTSFDVIAVADPSTGRTSVSVALTAVGR